MATSNLLQCLNEGADFGVSTSARRVVETYIAGETVAVGDAVSLDLSETEDGDKALKVVQSDSGTDTDRAFVGIVLRSAEPSGALTAGARVEVVVGGPAEANVDGATAAGNLLQIGSTAGRLAVREVNVDEGGAATFSLYPIAAIAAEADVANVATVFVYRQFN